MTEDDAVTRFKKIAFRQLRLKPLALTRKILFFSDIQICVRIRLRLVCITFAGVKPNAGDIANAERPTAAAVWRKIAEIGVSLLAAHFMVAAQNDHQPRHIIVALQFIKSRKSVVFKIKRPIDHVPQRHQNIAVANPAIPPIV